MQDCGTHYFYIIVSHCNKFIVRFTTYARVYDNMSLKLSNNLFFINYILIKTPFFFFWWDSHLIPNKLIFMKLIIQYYKNNVAVSTHISQVISS